jgi:hypothetical protein
MNLVNVNLEKFKEIKNLENNKLRINAYQLEADPLFFMYQRGECSKEKWLSKIEEIKQRFPNLPGDVKE